MLNLVVVLLIFFASLCWSAGGFADSNCPKESSATLISLQGKVLVKTSGKGIPHEVKLNEKICQGDLLSTQPNSRVSLELPGNEILRLKEQTEITLAELNIKTASIIKIAKGFLNFISRKPKEIKIESGITNAMPLGTEFAFNVDEAKASVWVYEGKVKVFNQYGSVIIEPGNSFAQVEKGQAPKVQIDIHPRDAVNWALYYPPLLPYPAKTNEIDGDIRLAIEDYRHGQVTAALTRLDALPPPKQSPYFHKVRGAMRLTVGQDELASEDINTLLAINPNDAEAMALQSVKALSQNHKEDAYTLANKAITADPQSASAYSALSYAEQGRFQLDKALAATKNAAKLAPHDAMTFARQAELELALGLSSDSEQSAQRALALDANLERTQTVTGFSYLTQMDTDEALQTFSQAIQLDSSAPLPRLGLGLAKIRDGNLAEGRKDIEIASLLDPNNSLIRSYLGKAYYEENRNPLAEDQFTLAKERDPKDPTPYFYDALKKQTENRPVEALKDLQTAMELNDNRAVYRSKQLLDSDRAARGASLARIYDNLGFQQRGVVEAISSLQTDPTNYSAHRFLSDTYVTQPGRETAQLSELLQAKMLQPININPVQPHLSVSQRGLLNASGIANSSFQDFTRVFEGNRPQLLVSGVAGNQGILGDEVVLSGIANKFSYSLGQFHYQTDGFTRPYGPPEDKNNTAQQHDIYHGFLQWAINDRINTQFEYMNRKTQQGSLQQTLNNINENYTERDFLNENSYRIGLNIKLSNVDKILASYIHQDIFTRNDFIDEEVEPPRTTHDISEDINIYEVQYLRYSILYNIFFGSSIYSLKQDTNEPSNPWFTPSFSDRDGHREYAYFNIKLPRNIIGTVGLSYNYSDKSDQGIHLKNYPKAMLFPKIGLLWNIDKKIKLRFAYFQGNQRPITSLQTIEPTQVAGFNQFFDDKIDRSFSFYGGAIDKIFSSECFAGFELSRREVFNDIGGVLKYIKDSSRAYVNWMPSDQFSISAQYNFFKKHEPLPSQQPRILSAHIVPVEIRYFAPFGLFTKLTTTYVNQEMDVVFNSQGNSNASSFFVLDASVGYRLPNRKGIISIEAKNLLDKKFRYEDLRGDETNIFFNSSLFTPQRTIFGRITLNF
ncbi:MAG: TonB-dependent receptor [Methyloglobulus sp.]|nr:TonB-dependent receptor [Methyloglobulus sp.]